MARTKLRKPFVVTTVSIGATAAALACSSSSSTSSSGGSAPDGSFVTTSNPPAINDCPTAKPTEGEACPENGVLCDYATDASCGDPGTSGSMACEVGLWTTKSSLPVCEAGSTDAGEDAADADAAD